MGYLGYKPADKPLTSADITDSIITSAKITDGTITNTDVASSIITGQTAENSIDGADSVLIYDDSASALRKMTRTNFVSGLGAAAGQVIQVVSATDTSNRTTTSTSFVTASNTLSVNITPASASNKILILVSIGYVYIPSGQNIRITLYRNNTTNLGSTDGFAWFNGVGGESSQNFSVYDSPSTTSSTNYQVYFKVSGGTGEIGTSLIKSTITALEIKG